MHKLTLNLARICALTLLWIGYVPSAWPTAIVYDFDTFNDSVGIANQYSGLAFINTTVLERGISLNEFSFPPHSGDDAAFDDGGPIVITFSSPVQSVSGYFTYLNGLTLSAYDSNNNLVDIAYSTFLTNLADGTGDVGSVPNELLSVAGMGDQIARIVVGSSTSGSSFVMDDLTVSTSITALPIPGTLPLILGGLALIVSCRARWRCRRSSPSGAH